MTEATAHATELAIGQVADATGFPVSVVRYYDEFGLINPVRRVGGKRRFDPDVVARLEFIRRSQAAGFSLDDIKALLDDQHGDWPKIVDRQLADLRQRRQELDAIIRTLEEALRCDCSVPAACSRVVAAEDTK